MLRYASRGSFDKRNSSEFSSVLSTQALEELVAREKNARKRCNEKRKLKEKIERKQQERVAFRLVINDVVNIIYNIRQSLVNVTIKKKGDSCSRLMEDKRNKQERNNRKKHVKKCTIRGTNEQEEEETKIVTII